VGSAHARCKFLLQPSHALRQHTSLLYLHFVLLTRPTAGDAALCLEQLRTGKRHFAASAARSVQYTSDAQKALALQQAHLRACAIGQAVRSPAFMYRSDPNSMLPAAAESECSEADTAYHDMGLHQEIQQIGQQMQDLEVQLGPGLDAATAASLAAQQQQQQQQQQFLSSSGSSSPREDDAVVGGGPSRRRSHASANNVEPSSSWKRRCLRQASESSSSSEAAAVAAVAAAAAALGAVPQLPRCAISPTLQLQAAAEAMLGDACADLSSSDSSSDSSNSDSDEQDDEEQEEEEDDNYDDDNYDDELEQQQQEQQAQQQHYRASNRRRSSSSSYVVYNDDADDDAMHDDDTETVPAAAAVPTHPPPRSNSKRAVSTSARAAAAAAAAAEEAAAARAAPAKRKASAKRKAVAGPSKAARAAAAAAAAAVANGSAKAAATKAAKAPRPGPKRTPAQEAAIDAEEQAERHRERDERDADVSLTLWDRVNLGELCVAEECVLRNDDTRIATRRHYHATCSHVHLCGPKQGESHLYIQQTLLDSVCVSQHNARALKQAGFSSSYMNAFITAQVLLVLCCATLASSHMTVHTVSGHTAHANTPCILALTLQLTLCFLYIVYTKQV
jgi:hypothetical protein